MGTDLEDLIERRRAMGRDLYYDIWDGEYHVAPAATHFMGTWTNASQSSSTPWRGGPDCS